MRASNLKSALSRDDLARIADACKTIGNEVADENGFVPVRNLLHRFGAKLVLRPLLVEGMLASIEHGAGNTADVGRWKVLVDSETYKVTERQINEECQEIPLPSRLRNTVAHELVHSLAFRPSEFGLQLRKQVDSSVNQSALVKEIEQQTERFSPFLLLSDKALARLLAGKESALSIEELTRTYRSMGISRYVMINRLRLIRPTEDSGFRHRSGLKNFAVGIGEWVDGKNAVLKGWPLFMNFDRNIAPEFLHKLVGQDRLPARAAFTDNEFVMCGGVNYTTELVVSAGLSAKQADENLKITCSIEQVETKLGAEFLFVVHKQI